MENNVSVRFAPSPTGALHIGGVRTALYNYLFAKKHQGRFVLRIEDTDRTRFVPGAEAYILETLQWLGITADEGPVQGGSYGPYRQSERTDIYKPYIDRLVAEGHAYYAFDTPEELEAMRERLKAARVAAPQYNAVSRAWMRNSLTLPQEEVAALLQSGTPYVIRIKVPHDQDIRLHDSVRGWVKVKSAAIDDKVLMKSDGIPTYHFANVVDDHLMQITHVIRGEEWLPSTPIHVLLYQYLSWEATMPQFVHLPLLLKPEGTGKLSKRDAEKHGFPIFPIAWQDPDTGATAPGFREQGYLPEALLNFLALLGWSAGDNQELLDKEALIQAFSLERVGKAGVKFDIQKAAWFNQQYLRTQPDDKLVQYLQKDLVDYNITATPEKVLRVCQLLKERVTFPHDFWRQGRAFFVAPETYDEKLMAKKWTPEAYALLQALLTVFGELPTFEAEPINAALIPLIEARKLKLNQAMPAIRIALTGSGSGPDLMQSMAAIGQEEVVARITQALERNPVA
ncbi:MAG: glutamate--tRNA ligase [Bacteroidota bacterium]